MIAATLKYEQDASFKYERYSLYSPRRVHFKLILDQQVSTPLNVFASANLEKLMHHYFVIFYRRGPAWIDGKTVFEQPLQAHLAYMRSLKEQSVLIFGGPFTDNTGGLIVVTARTLDEANAILNNDPAVQDRLMTAEVHPWQPMAGKDLLDGVVSD